MKLELFTAWAELLFKRISSQEEEFNVQVENSCAFQSLFKTSYSCLVMCVLIYYS